MVCRTRMSPFVRERQFQPPDRTIIAREPMPANTNVFTNVFISYATDTKPAAEELARTLEQNGIHAWADFKDLRAGQRWQREIEHAAESAQQFLVLVGPHSTASPWVEAEWRMVLAKAWSDSRKSVIPILCGRRPARVSQKLGAARRRSCRRARKMDVARPRRSAISAQPGRAWRREPA